MARARPLATAALAVGLCVAACNPGKNAFQLGLPGTRIELQVARVTPRAGYLDTTLQGAGWRLRSFLPASEACSAVVAGEALVTFRSSGAFGTLERDAQRCDAIGMGSLAEWRKKVPRGNGFSASVIPSALATYRVVFEDEEVLFLRGTFPLAGRLGFVAMGDAIAVVPNVPVCQQAIRDGRSTLEYFPAGKHVLTLGSAEGRCDIVGLLRPLAGADLGA